MDDDDMTPEDPDQINDYWDSLPPRVPEDDVWDAEPVAPKLRVVDETYEPEGEPERLVKATPFVWRASADIPKRQWLYGKHLLRKFVSLDVAAGGVGKSSLKVGEALAMASGRDIYGKGLPEGALNVWMWNLEDPHDEIERRLHATAQRFHIEPEDIADRLHVDSGRDQPLVMATEGPDGAMIVRPVVDALIAEMIARKIDVLQIDPFISSHAVSENDNNAIDVVAREWNVVAERTGAAINLVHHVRKQNGEVATADSARGASALIGKARSVLVYNRMTDDEANQLGVDEAERRFFFRVDNDKANLAPPEVGDWYRMNNQDLENGDSVGVACPWKPPELFDGMTGTHLYRVQRAVSEGNWRESPQSNEWVGIPIASALMLDHGDVKDRKKIVRMLKVWLKEGALEVVEMDDKQRRPRKFVVVGKWVEP
ncbi:MAG: AAA family ATPase [Sphingomonas sp.]